MFPIFKSRSTAFLLILGTVLTPVSFRGLLVAEASLNWQESRPAGDVNVGWWSVGLSGNDGQVMLSGSADSLYLSTNAGAAWSEVYPNGIQDIAWQVTSISDNGQVMLAGANTSGGSRLFVSTTTGSTWTEVRPAGNNDRNWKVGVISDNGQVMLAGIFDESSNGRLFVSTTTGSTWTEVRPAGNVNRDWYVGGVSGDGQVMLAASHGTNGRLYRSVDRGVTWTEMQPAGSLNANWRAASVSDDGQVMIAGIYTGRLYRSIDGGDTWSQVQPSGNNDRLWTQASVSGDGQTVIAGYNGGRLYLSRDVGDTWSETQPAGNANKSWWVNTISDNGQISLAGSLDNGRLYFGSGDSEAPEVYLTAPSAGATVSGTTTLSADADDNSLMGGVSFYVDGSLVGNEDTSSPYSIEWDSTTVSSGEVELVAVARDSVGNRATSTPRTITIDNEPTPYAPTPTPQVNGATITWTTGQAGSTRVYYGLMSATATSTPETNTGGGKTTSHSVSLGDLPSCVFYKYHTVNNSGSDIATSTERTFQTACTGSSSISTSTSGLIDVDNGGTVSHGRVTLDIPADVTSTTTEVVFQVNTLDAEDVIEAVGSPDDKDNIGGIFHLKAVYDETKTLSQFEEAVEVTISYDGVVGVDETSLFIGRYEGGQWHNMGGIINTVAKTVTATTSVVEAGGGPPAMSDWGIFGDVTPPASEEERSTSSSGGISTGMTFVAQLRNLFNGGNPEAAIKLILNNMNAAKIHSNEVIVMLRSYVSQLVAKSPSITSPLLNTQAGPDLELGMEGEDVRNLQKLLIEEGHIIPAGITGYFGLETKAALIEYQVSNGIAPASGYFGSITREKMKAGELSGLWW